MDTNFLTLMWMVLVAIITIGNEKNVRWGFIIQWTFLVISAIAVFGFLAWSFSQLVVVQF